MHYLDETHIFTFLIQVLTLLVVAKLLGELFRRWGFPAMVGEILTGIVLGPTLLGRATPYSTECCFRRTQCSRPCWTPSPGSESCFSSW